MVFQYIWSKEQKMKYTWVKGHRRKLPGQSKKKRNSISNRIILFACFGVLIFFALYYVLYLLSRIPLQVFFVFFLFILLAIVSFAALKIYQVLHRKRQAQENQVHQQYMQQVQAQQQMAQQQQTQQAMAHYQVQVQQQREHQRLAHIKTLGDMLTLTPPEFEDFVAKLMEASGYYEVQRVGKSGDLGADIVARDVQGNRVIVQCKKYSPGKSVGTPDLQKFMGAMIHYKAPRGVFVTTSTFSQPSEKLALDHKEALLIINGDQLVKWVQNTRTL
jgi:restriction endonuclease Mrr